MDGTTFYHVCRPYAAELRPIIHHSLSGFHVLIHLYNSVIIDDADACKGGFRSVNAHTHHLTVESEIFSRSVVNDVGVPFSLERKKDVCAHFLLLRAS